MTILLEISRPIQWRPGVYRSRITFRVWWLFFAVAVWPMREDEMSEMIAEGKAGFEYT